MTPPAFRKMPTELIENCTQYLETPDLCSFRLVCTQAEAQTVRTTGRRLFSTVNTSLMGAAMQRLDKLSRSEKFAKYVKNVRVEDDCEKIDAALPVLGTSDREGRVREMEKKMDVWPRRETQVVIAEETGAAKLTAMLREGRLRSESMTIRDHREGSKMITTVPVATLARDIIIDADLAITFFCMQSLWASVTEAVFHFDPQYQRKNAGFSRLREADVPIYPNTPAFWTDAVFRHAPQLQDLELYIPLEQPLPNTPPTSWIFSNTLPTSWTPPFALTSLKLSHCGISAPLIFSILSTSHSSLQSLTFFVVTLVPSLPDTSTSASASTSVVPNPLETSASAPSDWQSLLRTLSTSLPSLTYWELKLLSSGNTPVKFPSLSKDNMPEECREGLDVFVKGKRERGDERIRHVRYKGDDAGRVLGIAGGYVRVE
jgi:hypothetical protein